MLININDIPDDGLTVKYDGSIKNELLETDDTTSALLFLKRYGQDIIINGSVAAGLKLTCSRCLIGFASGIRLDIDTTCAPADGLTQDNRQLQGDELDVSFYRDGIIDIVGILTDILASNMEMKALCSEDCKGLCSRCGANLNEGACKCGIGEPTGRFGELLKKAFNDKPS